MENFGFIVACIVTIVLLFLVAAWFEKHFVKDRKAFSSTHYIASLRSRSSSPPPSTRST